ncbi:hypothetical protein FRP1_04960 [Pseudonocardia sp. EC080625-04]|uniref:GNAT family N-acetyltransferase n=1 Tax=Pseudonocardia sp. EC080625-04 TaxID=1096868 RepID=UPI0006CB20A5|nr:GNAT family N-acetyltransferase [Pseudonocardia sp. EC080625-04]ALE72617.1 hypothetical protein FRP1_04960 [Pseudonocardia sp. EC080625-04]
MDPRIRRRSPDDLPGCVAALAAVHGTDRYPMVWPGDPAGWLAPDGLLGAWVATVDDVVAGHVLLTADVGIAPVATVGRLFVAPRGRRRGIARLLLDHVREHARRHGLTLGLEVAEPGGGAAIELYERTGWTHVGTGTAGWTAPGGGPVTLRYYRC